MPHTTAEKTITSRDVARLAGVSQSAVSRAFSPNSPLSDKTRAHILQVARELGYKPNAIARSLVSSQTRFIGIVKGATNNPMFSELLTAITEEIQKTNYQVLYYESGPDQTLDDILERIFQYRVEGVILLYANLSSRITHNCRELGIPVLQMQRYSTNAQANVVLPDNERGVAMAVDLFIRKGYRSFAYVAGEMNSSSNLERQMGFLNHLRDCGVNDPIVVQGDYSYDSGYRALQQIAARASYPCGILCANDLMGLGIIDAAKASSLRIPQDIGVIGFDDNFMSSWPVYQLTSLKQPTVEMAKKGVEVLFQSITDRTLQPTMYRYDFELIERNSTNR